MHSELVAHQLIWAAQTYEDNGLVDQYGEALMGARDLAFAPLAKAFKERIISSFSPAARRNWWVCC